MNKISVEILDDLQDSSRKQEVRAGLAAIFARREAVAVEELMSRIEDARALVSEGKSTADEALRMIVLQRGRVTAERRLRITSNLTFAGEKQ